MDMQTNSRNMWNRPFFVTQESDRRGAKPKGGVPYAPHADRERCRKYRQGKNAVFNVSFSKEEAMLRKMKTNQEGFTLVEVIVVAVIVAVLAAVAIPVYRAYIINARKNSAENAGGSVASFCGACAAENGAVSTGTYTGPDSLDCGANTTTMRVPKGIEIEITGDENGGTVSSSHEDLTGTNDTTFTFKY